MPEPASIAMQPRCSVSDGFKSYDNPLGQEDPLGPDKIGIELADNDAAAKSMQKHEEHQAQYNYQTGGLDRVPLDTVHWGERVCPGCGKSLCAATVVLTFYTCTSHDCRLKVEMHRNTLVVNAFSVMSGTVGLLMARTKRASLNCIALANVVFGVGMLALQ
eukprot:gene6326-7580_t